jgi:hypothetical protein
VSDRAAKTSNFFDETTAQEAVLVRSGQENSLNIIGERFVSMSHLEFFLKIRKDSQTSQQHPSFPHFGIGYGQTVKTINFYVGEVLSRLTNLLNPFLGGKQWGFARISQHHHDHPLKELTASFNNIQMSQGDGIKAARVNCCHHSVCQSR